MDYQPQLFTHPEKARADEAGTPYLFSGKTLVAVDVALAAERPLLVSGPPGSGKSTLARAIATGLDARYLSRTVTSRTRIDDLFADLDTLERLADAQLGGERGDGERRLKPAWTYLRPGVLWWAFDPEGARLKGATAADRDSLGDRAPAPLDATQNPTEGNRTSPEVVVLLDEIDKADPDLPNDLLEPLDRSSFALPLADRPKVEKCGEGRVVLVLTTNGERELPPAFLRRCVSLVLEEPRSRAKSLDGALCLEDIASEHFRDADDELQKLFMTVADDVETLRERAVEQGQRPPSTAEYLDVIRALRNAPTLNQQAAIWEEVKTLLLLKASGPAG